MNLKRVNIKNNIISFSTSISSFLIPIFQYVPCTGVWFGIMSIPLIYYLGFFFQNPGIASSDIQFLIRNNGFYVVLFGFIIYIYSLIYQLTHRKQLMQTGPYKYVRHPQYIAFIIMTLGLTIITFDTSPIFNFNIGNLNGFTIILIIWIGEVIAYIVLGKIEEIALKAKYGDQFLKYASEVPFMVPFLKLKRNEIKKNN